jgi:hypothetical protein
MKDGKLEPKVIKIRRKGKRPGRSHRRRKNRRDRKGTNHVRNMAALKIQTVFREYIKLRYKEKAPKNYDDFDYIDMEKVSSIPKGLLVSINGTGYNSLSLLKWFTVSKIDPVTRKEIKDDIPIECAMKVIHFLENDQIFRKKKGHFSNRRQYHSVLMSCWKK